MRKFILILVLVIFVLSIGFAAFLVFKSFRHGEEKVVSQNFETTYTSEELKASRSEKQKALIETLQKMFAEGSPGTTFAVSIYDLNNDEGFGFNDEKAIHAASVSKILTATYAFKEVEDGKRSLTDPLGTYTLEWQVEKMINISNNPSWDLLDKTLGLKNQEAYARSIGLTTVKLDGNVMSPKDVRTLLVKLAKKEILNDFHRDKLFSYMQKTENETMIPQGLPKEIVFYHKSGAFEGEYHDAAYVVHPKNPFILIIFSINRIAPNYEARGAIIAKATKEVAKYFDGL